MEKEFINPIKLAKCKVVWSGLYTSDLRFAMPLALGAGALEYLSKIEDVICDENLNSAETLSSVELLINTFKIEIMEAIDNEQKTEN